MFGEGKSEEGIGGKLREFQSGFLPLFFWVVAFFIIPPSEEGEKSSGGKEEKDKLKEASEKFPARETKFLARLCMAVFSFSSSNQNLGLKNNPINPPFLLLPGKREREFPQCIVLLHCILCGHYYIHIFWTKAELHFVPCPIHPNRLREKIIELAATLAVTTMMASLYPPSSSGRPTHRSILRTQKSEAGKPPPPIAGLKNCFFSSSLPPPPISPHFVRARTDG